MRLMESQAQKLSKSLNDNSSAMSQLNKRQKELVSQQTKLEMSVEKQRQSVSEARKEWKKLGDEQSEMRLSKAKEEYNALTHELKQFKSAAKEATTDVERLSSAQSKMGNRSTSLVSRLGEAGFIKLGGDLATEMAETFVNSAFGSEAGSMFSKTLSGAVNGAAMGTLMGAPGIGAAIGAGAGFVSGAAQKFEAKDDFFRSEVQELYTRSQNQWALDLQNGTDYTMSKQKNIAAMSTSLGGREKGERMYEDIRDYGINTPYQGANVLNSAKQMLAYGIDEDDIMENIRRLGDIGMGDQQKLDSLSYAYAQIQSAGRLQGQDLLQMTSAGFNPLKVLAEEQGRTLEEMRDLMSKGLVAAADVTHAIEIATNEGGQFYGSAKDQMNTYAGKKAQINDTWEYVNSGYGDGYTSARMGSMTYENYWLGEYGEKLKKLNELSGEISSREESEATRLRLQSNSRVLNGLDLDNLDMNNAADREAVRNAYAQIEAEAEADWLNSATYKEQQEQWTRTAEIMQTTLRDEPSWIETGRQIGLKLSEGILGGFDFGDNLMPNNNENGNNFGSPNPYTKQYQSTPMFGSPNPYKSHATGLNRVPYNNYPALLHEGEKVLTASEVRSAEQKQTSGINVNIASLVVREEADIDKIAKKIAEQVVIAKELSS